MEDEHVNDGAETERPAERAGSIPAELLSWTLRDVVAMAGLRPIQPGESCSTEDVVAAVRQLAAVAAARLELRPMPAETGGPSNWLDRLVGEGVERFRRGEPATSPTLERMRAALADLGGNPHDLVELGSLRARETDETDEPGPDGLGCDPGPEAA